MDTPINIPGMGPVFVTGGSGFVGQQLIRRLVDQGVVVNAAVRSPTAAKTVASHGAVPVSVELSDLRGLAQAMTGAGLVVHAAAQLTGADVQGMHEVNVEGTRNVVKAAQSAGVPTFVHVSTEQVVLGDRPIIDADESWPYPQRPQGPYARTKGEAERIALGAATDGFRVVAVRPRFVWGVGDTTVLPAILEAVESGAFRWIDHGRYQTSTCHVRNLVEGILAAAHAGESGSSYFLSDGPPVEFRDFVTAMARTKGVDIPGRSLPRPLAHAVAAAAELVWRVARRTTEPPIDRARLAAIGQTCTVNDTAARSTLGYTPVVTVQEGLRDMAEAT